MRQAGLAGPAARAWAGTETPPKPVLQTGGAGWLQELLRGVTFSASQTQCSEDAQNAPQKQS